MFYLDCTAWHAVQYVLRDTCFCCSGNGTVNCTPSSQLLQLYESYISDGVGSLACDQGQDLVYPEGAPGFVYDPTGYLLTLPGRQVQLRSGNKQTVCGLSVCCWSCVPTMLDLCQMSDAKQWISKRTAEAQKGL